jgi:lysophospholipase L1-like esterase
MRRTVIIFVVALAALGGWLWWSYAHIYLYIGAHYTPEPGERVYTVGTGMPEVYVALGDSLTAGVGVTKKEDTYPYRYVAQASATRSVHVTNLGIPGAVSVDVLKKELPKVAALHPDVVTLMIGINDIRNFVPIETFKSNLASIVQNLETTDARVAVTSIPILSNPALVIAPYRWDFAWRTREFNAAITAVCTAPLCIFIDLSSTDARFASPGAYYSADLFHPSALGYALWADILYAHFHP